MMNGAVIIVVVVLLVVLIWFFSVYNTFIRLRTKIDEAESGIDVALTKRFDVLTKMVDVVKGYAKHEKETLENVIKLRNQVHAGGTSISQKQEMTQAMNDAMRAINVVVEQYPDLKANDNFKQLQVTIVDVEEHLQASRRLYNSNVSLYNQKVQMIPTNIVAGIMGLTTREFFEADVEKRQDVKMDF